MTDHRDRLTCPQCGSPGKVTEWDEIDLDGSGMPTMIPVSFVCTFGCEEQTRD